MKHLIEKNHELREAIESGKSYLPGKQGGLFRMGHQFLKTIHMTRQETLDLIMSTAKDVVERDVLTDAVNKGKLVETVGDEIEVLAKMMTILGVSPKDREKVELSIENNGGMTFHFHDRQSMYRFFGFDRLSNNRQRKRLLSTIVRMTMPRLLPSFDPESRFRIGHILDVDFGSGYTINILPSFVGIAKAFRLYSKTVFDVWCKAKRECLGVDNVSMTDSERRYFFWLTGLS